jgi:uncharacterized membrane protein YsdA (DUF1294 family)
MQAHGKRRFLLVLSTLFFLALVAAYRRGYVPQTLMLLYFTMSVITFTIYAVDKSKAKRKAWRIQESTLHMFSLAGGWPGAIYAQEFLRHKSVKGSFRLRFYVSLVLNITILAALLSSYGESLLDVLYQLSLF